MPSVAVPAFKAGHMVGSHNPIPNLDITYTWSNSSNFTSDFMAKYQGHFIPAVPFHDVTAADTAGMDFYKGFTGANLWSRKLFDPDIAVTVVTGDTHYL